MTFLVKAGLRLEIWRAATTWLSIVAFFCRRRISRTEPFAFKLVSAHPITCRCPLMLFKPFSSTSNSCSSSCSNGLLLFSLILTFPFLRFFCFAIDTTNFPSFFTAAKRELKPKKMIKNCFRKFFCFFFAAAAKEKVFLSLWISAHRLTNSDT